MKKLTLMACTALIGTLAAKQMVVHTSKGTSTFDITAIDSITFSDEQLQEQGIAKYTISLFNGWGRGFSALDAVKGEGLKVFNIDKYTGNLIYQASDSTRADFKTVNSYGRATSLTPYLVSLNGTKYAAVDSTTFAEVTKNVKTFSTKLKAIADAASSDTLHFTGATPYFVAKLGNTRGYCLAKVASYDGTAMDSSATNTGRIDLDYYYVSNAQAQ